MNDRKISCKQVKSILPFFIKGTVNPFISELIEEHLAECESCKKLYLKLLDEYEKSLVPNFDDIEIEITAPELQANDEIYATGEYQAFKKKLSAYFDSELGDKEQIKMKKLTISNPLARRDFENLYRFKQLLHSSFEKTKNGFKKDFSSLVMKKLAVKPVINKNLTLEISFGLIFAAAAVTALLHFKF